MAKVFCIDVAKCSGCYNCQFACKDEHCNNEWLPIAAQQPMIGQFWLQVEEHVEGTKPKVKIHYIPVLCNHCSDPACMKAAKDGAVYKREDGLVIIDPEKAIGQKQIVEACPYGAIYWNEEKQLPQKCTGCAHLIEEGKTPRCVDVCHTGAIQFGEESDFADFIEGATVRLPESGNGPKVYYRNIPGRFIGGTIYDPDEEVVVRNAVCRLTKVSGSVSTAGTEPVLPAGANPASSAAAGSAPGAAIEPALSAAADDVRETSTDVFGDFWFKDLPQGIYDLSVEADGFETLSFKGIDTTNDSINLGDQPMKRK